MLQHRYRYDSRSAETRMEFAEPKCPAVLRHPIWSPGFVLLILVAEAFALGMIAGAVLHRL